MKAIFAPEYKWRLVEEFGHKKFSEQPDGKLLFSFGFTDHDNLLSWILTFGSGAELLEPVEFRRELHQISKDMLEKYRDS